MQPLFHFEAPKTILPVLVDRSELLFHDVYPVHLRYFLPNFAGGSSILPTEQVLANTRRRFPLTSRS